MGKPDICKEMKKDIQTYIRGMSEQADVCGASALIELGVELGELLGAYQAIECGERGDFSGELVDMARKAWDECGQLGLEKTG
jgi:hypothetical protein